MGRCDTGTRPRRRALGPGWREREGEGEAEPPGTSGQGRGGDRAASRPRGAPDPLIGAGSKALVRARIRDEMSVKLWGNLAFNPLSAPTAPTLDALIADPGTRGVARAMMPEGQAVAEALGVRFAIGVDKRIEGAAEVGRHKTSMLQDLDLGRPLEIEALLGAVVELAGWVAVPTPLCSAVLALVRRRAAARTEGE